MYLGRNVGRGRKRGRGERRKKKNEPDSEVGMWPAEGEGKTAEEKKKVSGTGERLSNRLCGSPSQITSVYALKCEMVQTAQLP